MRQFRDALLCQWLVASIDSHAKNHSLMLLGQGVMRLAPVYDLNSWLPYRQNIPVPMLRMAMGVGRDVTVGSADQPEAMRLTAERLGLSPLETAERAVELATQPPWALEDAIEALPSSMADLPGRASRLPCHPSPRTEVQEPLTVANSSTKSGQLTKMP